MGRKSNITSQTIEDVIEMRKSGMKRTQIAELVGISGWTVGKILREQGMTRNWEKATKTGNTSIPAHLKGLEAYKPREIFAYLRFLGYRGKLNFTQEIEL